jgi:hypothetical protein
MTKFNLSEKITSNYNEYVYRAKDVKEFIRRLKNEKFWKSHNEAIEFGKWIDKLAGSKLVDEDG